MLRCKKLPLIPLLLLLPLAAAQQPPEPAAPAFDAGVVAGEVQEFYASYRQAWDDRDPEAVNPHGVVKVDRKAAVAGVERFFEAVRRRDVLWRRSVLSIEPRSATEAMAVVRNDFSLAPAGEVELALEVLRKGKDGRWQLVRRWSEKHNF
jgi:hypothetical protein